MTVTELHERIVAELDRLDGIEGEATKGPWHSIGMTVRGQHPKGGDRMRLVASFRVDKGTYQQEAWANTNLATTARNLFPGMLAFMRQQAEWALEGALYGDGGTQLAKDYLRSIAAALGVEVTE